MAAESLLEVLSLEGGSLSLPATAFTGSSSTLCKGCGHNSITSALIDACKSMKVNPYSTIKISGIGCSSKTPAYFLQASHGFNALHGRMPSVATGALLANRNLLCIGVSGDGDTANIGLGQFKHVCRRNLQVVYLIENNGCYGLTKGQFSATADFHAKLRRETGEENRSQPFDLCLEAIAAGATFVARSFAGDRKQLLALLKGALAHKGTSILDIISPCVTFNDFPSSTKSWEWAKDHEEPLQELGFVPRLPEISIEQKEGKAMEVRLHDGSVITLRAVSHGEHDVRSKASAYALLANSHSEEELITGLIYVDPDRTSFTESLETVPRALASLSDSELRPPKSALEAIMAAL